MEKLIIYIGLAVGAMVGAYVPVVLLDVSTFSWVSLVCGVLGGVIGIWLGWKLTSWVGD
jgi:hypothetical protein